MIHIANRPLLAVSWWIGLALLFPCGGDAAPRATDLGPPVTLAEPSGGYVGELNVTPAHGPVGTPITVTGEGFPAGQQLDLVWSTVRGRWKVTTAEYLGREYSPAAYRIATVTSDAAGHIAAQFTAPDDFGFQHDVIVQQGDRLLTKNAFSIDMTVKVLADNVPVGTPVPMEVQGIGWRELEGSWVMLYDNRFTGWISTVTTSGTARFTVPAAGRPGSARDRSRALRLHVPLPQHAAVAGAGSPAIQGRLHHCGGTRGASRSTAPAGTDPCAPAAAARRTGGDAGICRRRPACDRDRLRFRIRKDGGAALDIRHR